MTVEQNKGVARRWTEQSWQGSALDEELVAADAVFHRGGSLSKIRSGMDMFRAGVPDLVSTVEDQIGEGEKVVTRWTVRGTHTGDLQGVPPTGVKVVYTGITINRIVDGRIVEDWFEADVYGLMEQIGALDRPNE